MIETLLSEAMHEATDDVHLAPNVIAGARRSFRRRQLRTRAMVATTATAVVGGGIAIAMPGRQPVSNPRPAVNMAYIQNRLAASLADSNDFLVVSTVTSGANIGTLGGKVSGMAGVTMTAYQDSRDGRKRFVAKDSSGAPLIETGAHFLPSGRVDLVTVDYQNDSVTHATEPAAVLNNSDRLGVNPLDPEQIRAAVDQGTLSMVGTEQIDGHEVEHLRLTGAADAVHAPDGSTVDLYVDRGTYQLRRMTLEGPKGGPLLTQDLTWEPLTAANAGEATVVPPSGS